MLLPIDNLENFLAPIFPFIYLYFAFHIPFFSQAFSLVMFLSLH